MRVATVERNTRETQITGRVDLDGAGIAEISTGIGFLDHMLEQLAKHSLIDISLHAVGDLHIDFHHTTEDTGYVVGEAVSRALGDRAGIARYGHAVIPMDETLTRVSLDASNRPYLDLEGRVHPAEARRDGHRAVQGMVPGLRPVGRGDPARRKPLRREQPPHRRDPASRVSRERSRQAVEIDPRRAGAVPSTKGVLGGSLAMKVAIIDYGSGNLRSAAKAFERAAARLGSPRGSR